ncbi:superoxide dismutase family protein [Tsukamurella sp. 8F]|uniref:superoxide dismutase[Cu-Zn] n=1 Tax=unclassified Tsukamurella TaxID=2633480 RepID=UPI0023B99829|nr:MULTISPECIES: superoxide dismutase family protein [unclassified Tsukamurella]MDF0529478.1 superoxide dismutase family protein [Tsukamurella sp. 8J]MDF0585834.1 superoxide dismutase family protein [Tsukamurella sp. 8F]
MTKRMSRSRALVLPALALAVVGLAGCAADEQASDVKKDAPVVVSGNKVPSDAPIGEKAEGGHGESDGSGGGTESGGRSQAATAPLKKADGSSAGTATFTEKDGVVVVDVKVTGLPAGFHGLHVHSVGKCEAPSTAPSGGAPGAFLSAGSHFQVSGHTGHPASGDLVSIYVNSNGTGETVTTTSAFKVSDLTSGAGTSIMVHADPDNFGNVPATKYANITPGQPVPDQSTMDTGDAGARIACGVIKAG